MGSGQKKGQDSLSWDQWCPLGKEWARVRRHSHTESGPAAPTFNCPSPLSYSSWSTEEREDQGGRIKPTG